MIAILNIPCGWPLNHFYSVCEVFLSWVPYGWTIFDLGAYICSVCSLFQLFVLCFDVSPDKSQTVFGLVCDNVYMRWPIEVTTDNDPDIFCVFCGSEGGVMKCVWEDNRFLFSVYSKNLSELNSIDHSFSQNFRLCKSSWRLCADACDFIVSYCVVCKQTHTTSDASW